MTRKTFFKGLIMTVFLIFGIQSLCQGEDVIYGCYKKENGQLRVVTSHSQCLDSESPITLYGEPVVSNEFTVNCDNGEKIQDSVNRAKNGDTIFVSGVCNENVIIGGDKTQIILDGQGTAVINGVDPSAHGINVRGRRIVIKNFTITGGLYGIMVNLGASAFIYDNIIQDTGHNGISVYDNSSATIDGNHILNTGGNGTAIGTTSSARIINNTIKHNPGRGIIVHQTSSARIGFNSFLEISPSPNTIENNGKSGIIITDSSSAFIVGNSINNNNSGILIWGNSYAHASLNIIEDNNNSGVGIFGSSSIELGHRTGTSMFDLPNETTINNGNYGISCKSNSHAGGRIGSLNGTLGASDFSASCVASLL